MLLIQLAGVLDVVCGVIVDECGRLLACQRPADVHLGGLWEFPGGKVEAGESLEAALIRELWEELGVSVAVGAALTPVIWEYPGKTIRLLPFLCRITGGELHANEHQQLRWCRRDECLDLPWAGADLPILREISAEIAHETPD